MKRIATIIGNIAIAGVVAWFCLGSVSVEAQPIGDRFEEGYQAGDTAGYEQGYVENVIYREVTTYVDREVTVNRTLALRDFDSLEELEIWLVLDDTNEYVYLFADASGEVARDERYDCDDYAIQLQRRAVSSGYLMSVTLVDDPGQGPHMVNLAVIGDKVYYIEPQTDEYWYYCDLD